MLRALVAIAIAMFAMQARAQVTGSATFVSDYRFRGVSLSDDRPSAQVAFGYDLPASGWYAGGVVSSVRLEDQKGAQLLGYGGYAHRLLPDLSWEAGVEYSRFTGRDSYAYAETYVGVAYRKLVGRLYYAPDYFHSGTPVLYAELNGSHALAGKWYVFGHLGTLRRNGHAIVDHAGRFRPDVRLGLGLAFDACNVQLSWTGVHGARGPDYDYGYPVGENVSRDAWVVSFSFAW